MVQYGAWRSGSFGLCMKFDCEHHPTRKKSVECSECMLRSGKLTEYVQVKEKCDGGRREGKKA